MSLKHGLLGLLNYGQMSGYDLDKVFKASLNFFWSAQTSQVYRELNTMEKAGWLSSKVQIQTDKPNKKLYSITDAGKEELERWLSGDHAEKKIVTRDEFLLRLFFSGERSVQDNIETLKIFKSRYEKALEEMSKTGSNINHYREEIDDDSNLRTTYWELTARFGMAYMNMCVDFAESAIQTLEGVE